MNESTNTVLANRKKQILKSISGEFDLPPVARMYVIGLAFTAGAVLLLPLLYFSLIALVVGAMFAVVRNADLILLGASPVAKSAVLGVAICCGTAFVLALLKPFLAKSSATKRPQLLSRHDEPFLYEYVERLSDALGTRRPNEIYISCGLNAGAELQSGWLSLFDNKEFALHLGLPLIAGLTLRQFTGVAAHELGHFTQRTAMWLENLVRRINQWFSQSACERDSVDDWLARHCAARGPMTLPCYCARAVVWIARCVLRGLAFTGTLISCLMSREMEFNADRCEVRTVGPRTFAATMWRMRELSLAHQVSFRDIAAFSAEGRLPDNMIALAVANIAFVSPKLKKKLRRMMNEEKTGLFDSHPSDRDRLNAGITDGSPGFVQRGLLPNDLPASVLFNRFEEISRVATTRFYMEVLNQPIKPRMLHPVEKLLERQNVEIEASKALRRYFQTDIPPLRPLPIAPQSADIPENPEEVASELKASRERMVAELANYKRLTPRYQTAEETLFETIAAQSLIQARLQFNPAEFHLNEIDVNVVADKYARTREGVTNLAGKLLPFESEAGNRLSFALQLLNIESVAQKIPRGDDLPFEIEGLLPEAQFVSRLVGELPTLRIIFYRLLTLWERVKEKPLNQRVLDIVVDQQATLRNRLVSIQAEMGGRLYPFDHAQANTTMQEYILPQIPDESDLGGLVEATERMQSRLISVQSRLFTRLAQAAEQVEEAIGMPPLPEPDEEPDK